MAIAQNPSRSAAVLHTLLVCVALLTSLAYGQTDALLTTMQPTPNPASALGVGSGLNATDSPASTAAPPSPVAFGWTCAAGWTQTLDDFTGLPICVRLQLQLLPSVSTQYFCQRSAPGLVGYTPQAMPVHSATLNQFVLNLSQPAFTQQAIKYAADRTKQFVLLGGVMLYGQTQWFDQSPVAPFTNLTSGAAYAPDSMCLALQPSGAWAIVSCTDAYRPFLCYYALGAPATVAPTPQPPFATQAPGQPGAPPTGTAQPPQAPPRAPRPGVPQPPPACLPGWSASPATGKCYQLVAWSDFTGTGLTSSQARQVCKQLAPNADLTSVLDGSDTAILASLMANQSLRTLLTFAFVGGVFTEGAQTGAWFEDYAWYGAAAYPAGTYSSVSWPTAANRFYTNWADNEPATPFGCLAVDLQGRWYARSCQESLPYVCSYLNDGSTFAPPTAPPPVPTAQPTQAQPGNPTPVPTIPVLCPVGWTPFLQTRRCYSVLVHQIPGYDAEAECNGALPTAPNPMRVHAAPITSVFEGIFVGQLAQAANVSQVAFGLAFSQFGQILQFLDGETNADPAFAKAQWAPGQPTFPSGLVAIDTLTFQWTPLPMAAAMPALVCSYAFDTMGGVVTINTPAPALWPGETGAPTAMPNMTLAQRIQSFNGATSFYVAVNTIATYTISYVGEAIDQNILLFSPIVAGGPVCNNNHKSAYATQIVNGMASVQHGSAQFSGVVCVASVADPLAFAVTNISFTTLPLAITGLLLLPQVNSFATPVRYNTSSPDTPAPQQNVLIRRRSSGSLQLFGSSYELVVSQLRSARFSATTDCMGSIYSFGNKDLQVPLDLIVFQLIDVEILRADLTSPFDDASARQAPTTFFVCIAVSPDPSIPSTMYSAVPGMTVALVPQRVALRGMFVVENLRGMRPTYTATVTVPQYSSPRIAFDADGLAAGRMFLFSYSASQCTRQQLVPAINSSSPYDFSKIDPNIPASINTISVVDVLNTGAFTMPYVQLSLNHTGMWGIDPSVTQQVLFLCFAYSTVSAFLPTSLQVVVQRVAISSITTQDTTFQAAQRSAALSVNTGFAGLLTLWGIDTRLWSLETLSNTQIAFAQHRPGSSPILPFALQCANTSLFYGNRAVSVVVEKTTNTSSPAFLTSDSLAAVIPPRLFTAMSMRWMRVCLSVPHPFDSTSRAFLPTTATLDVQPIQLSFIGPFGADSIGTSKLSLVALPENADNVVLPLSGYGLQADMTLFLSAAPCMPQGETGDAGYVGRTSLLNISIFNFFDVPRTFRANLSEPVTAQLFAVFTKEEHTNAALADRLFGGPARNQSLWVCLFAPQTRNLVYATVFQLAVLPRRVDGISNLFTNPPVAATTGLQQAQVTYGEFIDLQVFGFGLRENFTVVVPALDCANESSYLWWSPVALSPVPSLATSVVQDFTQRYQNSQTGYASWYLPLNQQQTTRIGSVMPKLPPGPRNATTIGYGLAVTRFQWCVRFDRSDPSSPFIPTGLQYRLNLVDLTGFVVTQSNGVTKTTPSIALPQQNALLGSWANIQFTGPLIDRAAATGNLIYMFLAQPLLPCAVKLRFIVNSNDTDRYLVVGKDGQTLVLPLHASVAGTFKICYSVVFPTAKALREDKEAALRFVEAPGLSVIITPPQYMLFALNGTTQVSARRRGEWLLSVAGSSDLSGRTKIRFIPTADATADRCNQPMKPGLDDIIVRQSLPNQTMYGRKAAQLYMLLEREVTIGLPSGMYFACFQANPAAPWLLSSVMLNLLPFYRAPTYYNYFAADGSRDIADVRTTEPTKLVRSWNSGLALPETISVVGTAGREIVLQLWCSTSAGNGAVQLCGNRQRVLLVRPLLDPFTDPCFVDEDDILGLNSKGPFVIRDGILTLPRGLSEKPAVTWFPNVTDPWVMCVEAAPMFFRQAFAPQILVEWTTVSVTGFIVAGPDTVSNSTASYLTFETAMGINDTSLASPPAASFNLQSLVLYAQDLTQVFFLNGFGVQYGMYIRFGPQCDSSNVTLNTDSLFNPSLYTKPLLVGDDKGSVVIPSTHYLLPEASPIPMCISADGMATFIVTQLQLVVLPSKTLVDSTLENFNDQHAVVQALSDTVITPRLSRGLVDLSRFMPKGQKSPVTFGAGAQLLLSSDCLYSAQGLPVLTISKDSLFSLSYAVTAVPTPQPLKICVRRIVLINTINDGVPQYVYQTPMFVDSGLRFKVLNVTVASVSLHNRTIGVEANHDIQHMVFTVTNTETILKVQVQSSQSILPTAASPTAGLSDVSASFDDVNVLAMLNLVRFRVGAPCIDAHPMSRKAYLSSTSSQTASFYKGQISVSPDSSARFVVPLLIDPDIVATPWNPLSVCMTVDGGRQFINVGIVYFSARWAPTLLVAQRQTVRPIGVRRIASSWTSDVVVYESTSISTAYTDSRFDSRVYANTAADFVDTELSRELGLFTISALWTGFIGDVGYCESGSLFLPSQVVSDSALINVSSPALVSSDPHPLAFYFDANNNNIATGSTISILPMQLQCLDGSITSVTVHREEPGRVFSLLDPRCSQGLNPGQTVRLVPLGASCMASAYAVDAIVDRGMNLIVPFQVAYLPDTTTYQLCFNKYLPLRIAAVLGMEAVKVATPVRITVAHTILIDSLNGLASGTLVVYQGCAQTIAVTGSGLGSNSVVLSSIAVDNTSVPLSDGLCAVASTYMNTAFQPVNGTAQNPLATWFPITLGAVTISENATARLSLQPRVLCYSADSGITFQLVGSGIYFAVLPLVATEVYFVAPDERQLYDPYRSSASAQQLVRFASPLQPADPATTLTAFSHALPTLATELPPAYSPYASPYGVVFGGNGFQDLATAFGGAANTVRATVLVGYVRSSIVGSSCNGQVSPAAVVATVQVQLLSGRSLPSSASRLLDLFAQNAPSEPLVVCTSSDKGATFWSANSPLLALPAVPVITTTNRFNASAIVFRLDAEVGFSSRVDDVALMLLVAIRVPAAAAPVKVPLAANAMASTLAALLGIDPSIVTVYITPVATVQLAAPNDTVPQVAQLYDVAVKVTAASVITVASAMVNLSWAPAVPAPGPGVVLPIPAILCIAAQIVRDNVSVLQSLVTPAAPYVTSVMTSRFVFADGVLLTTDVRAADQASGIVSASDLASYDLLLQFTMDLVSTVRAPVVVFPPGPPKSRFSAIPIVLLMPLLFLFATYKIYQKYFLVVVPAEEKSAAERYRAVVAAFRARQVERLSKALARHQTTKKETGTGDGPSNASSMPASRPPTPLASHPV